MWKLIFALALPLSLPAAAHSGAPGDPALAQAAGEPQCVIRSSPVANGIKLEAVVASEVPLSGTYHFDVRKTGSAGISSSAQSGTFEAEAGEVVVGQVQLGLESDASYNANLELRWNGGEASCDATGPDRA